MWKKIKERNIEASGSASVMAYKSADYIKNGDYSFIVTVCIKEDCTHAICMGTSSQIKKGGDWSCDHISASRVKEESKSYRRWSITDFEEVEVPIDFVFEGTTFPEEI